MEIVFLGTGGGRWVTLFQELKTGGFRVEGRENIHVDPGPGALVNLREADISPLSTHSCVVTHAHPDHYSDAELMVEGMTRAMTRRRGVFAGSRSAVKGGDGFSPVLSRYHSSKLESLKSLSPGEETQIKRMNIKSLPTRHSDSSAVGLRIEGSKGTLVYTSDTQYFEGMEESYKGARVIILNVVRAGSRRIKWHLCTQDLMKILPRVEPELAVMQHFGMTMLSRMDGEAERVEKETGIRTIAAKDFMRIKVEEDISIEE